MQQASETQGSRVRVAVVDDFQMIVDGLISHLSTHDVDIDIDVDVVISATSWDGLTSHPEYPTDVTVLDLNLGDQIRIETKVRALTAAGSAVIVISRHTSALGIARALDAGALGFVPKSAPAAELIAAVRAVASGNRYVSELYEPPALDLSAGASLSLGTQEHRALVLYAEGRSIRDVAVALDTTEETAKSYVKRARSKYRKAGINLGSKMLLRRYALLEGWIESE